MALFFGWSTLHNRTVWQPVAVLATSNAVPNAAPGPMPQWQLERSADSSQLRIRALSSATLAASKSYELWVLPGAGGKPVSLGVMPTAGSLERSLNDKQRQLLLTSDKVAVTLEPAGGSPTGDPTGPVVMVAPIMRSI